MFLRLLGFFIKSTNRLTLLLGLLDVEPPRGGVSVSLGPSISSLPGRASWDAGESPIAEESGVPEESAVSRPFGLSFLAAQPELTRVRKYLERILSAGDLCEHKFVLQKGGDI